MYQAQGWFFADQDTHFAHMISKNIKKGGPAEYQQPVRHKSFEFVSVVLYFLITLSDVLLSLRLYIVILFFLLGF